MHREPWGSSSIIYVLWLMNRILSPLEGLQLHNCQTRFPTAGLFLGLYGPGKVSHILSSWEKEQIYVVKRALDLGQPIVIGSFETFPVFALKVLYPRKPLSFRQTVCLGLSCCKNRKFHVLGTLGKQGWLVTLTAWECRDLSSSLFALTLHGPVTLAKSLCWRNEELG